MIKMIIVNDHPVVRRGLKQIIAAEDEMQVVGETETAGKSLKEIGVALCISGKTVSTYRARIMHK